MQTSFARERAYIYTVCVSDVASNECSACTSYCKCTVILQAIFFTNVYTFAQRCIILQLGHLQLINRVERRAAGALKI